jgi:hypothetical protein
VPAGAHEAWFGGQLGDIDEPTAPFGMLDVQGGGEEVEEVTILLSEDLAGRIREAARRQGVSAAVLFHVAWAQVLAQCSGREEVVFGTVLTGRLQGGAGADRALGMFINTLPARVSLGGRSVQQVVGETYQRLSELLEHEQASLALAQRCSGVAAPLPLFTTLLNYRHSHVDASQSAALAWEGIRALSSEERTNYPIAVSVDDLGELRADAVRARSGGAADSGLLEGCGRGRSGGAEAGAGAGHRRIEYSSGGRAAAGAGGVQRHGARVSAGPLCA